MSIMAIQEGSVVLNVVHSGHAAVNLVGHTAVDKSGGLDNIPDFAIINLGSLNDTVVLSGRGTGDLGIFVVNVCADLLSDVLSGRSASDELVDGGR